MTLTKSLHTVTAVTNVAKYILRFYLDPNNADRRPGHAIAEWALTESLGILGYALSDFSTTDPVIVAARKQILKMVGEK